MKMLTNSTFDKAISSDKLTVVDFFADWCGPCKMVAPILEELENEYLNIVDFCKFDIDGDEEMEISAKYNVRAVPTIMFFKNGEALDTILGAVPKTVIEEKIKAL